MKDFMKEFPDEINRDEEYKILGKILVDFEKIIDYLRFKIHTKMYSLGLNGDIGQTAMDILLANMSAYQTVQKFRSLHIEIFSDKHFLTKRINLFTKCMLDLIEIRNKLIHATWLIGYDPLSGSEERISRGFSDWYGKKGFIRKRIPLNISLFNQLDKQIELLFNFMNSFDIIEKEKKIKLREDVNEEVFTEIYSFLQKFKAKMETVF
jgi:hypothetical protein